MAKGLLKYLIVLLSLIFVATSCGNDEAKKEKEQEEVDVKELIFHHLGDGYGWEVPFMHEYRIPLPVIVRAEDHSWHIFSSNKLTELEVFLDTATGKTTNELWPVPYTVKKDGKDYTFILSHGGNHPGKLVQIFPLEDGQTKEAEEAIAAAAKEEKVPLVNGKPVDFVHGDGFLFVPANKWDGVKGGYYRDYKPLDVSITKNVLALVIASFFVALMLISLARFYRKKGYKAPRKGMGLIELAVEFVYNGVIKPTLGINARKYAPYLLTCFFFILVMNLLGLIVIFPGGANLTGNIAITMVLAVLTFIMTNIKATKHYWKEILWPDVPIWLKCPIPIMQFIEIFGIFTKPAALCVRLFANMMGGHMIVITLVCLIFVFAAFGAAAVGGVTILSVVFSIFMLGLDILVSFIQAYVFTMLSTLFISMAQDTGHGHGKDHKGEEEPEVEKNGGSKSSPAPVNVSVSMEN